ncbi:MAG: hypothetical protein HY788_10085 [Deltaproteobacteria bacterium]|nr:hypothetical protein [Deltaproteobacteria bacterium]
MSPKKDIPPWYRPRRYLHFDLPITLRQPELLVTNPTRVQQHAFYPFISYDIKSEKVEVKEDGLFERKRKDRPVSYASHVDSHVYSYYGWLLNKEYEKRVSILEIGKNVLAFRDYTNAKSMKDILTWENVIL